MSFARSFAAGVAGILFLVGVLDAQSRWQYRDFRFGSDLASVATLVGVSPSQAKTIHERPAVLRDLDWRPSHWVSGSLTASTDPVEQIAFSFYNDQLFRVVIDYSRVRTEGMTGSDMIESISAVYGAPSKVLSRANASRVEVESGVSVARWGDAEYSVVLYRLSTYREGFRLVATSAALDGLAREAATQAIRLDQQEAPRREIARQQKERDDGRAAEEKARIVNKEAFRP